jgi:hypothetical protein
MWKKSHRTEGKERTARRDEKLEKTLARALQPIFNALYHILLKENLIMSALDDLAVEVAETEGAVQEMIDFVKKLRDDLANAGTDPTKLAELTKRLDDVQKALKAAKDGDTGGGSTQGV